VTTTLTNHVMQNFLRQQRTDKLIAIIADYDHMCFKSVAQRMTRNSLRVAVSPDNTLAYIDFLFDDSTADSFAAPLTEVGQPRLPAAFRMAGIGSYFTPWYLDTNDVLLQAVSSTDVASSFIDEAWITFIVELNTVLRTMRTDSMHRGLTKLIRFLSRPVVSERLGGVLLELCTFSNFCDDDDATAENSVPADPASQSSVDSGTISSLKSTTESTGDVGAKSQPSTDVVGSDAPDILALARPKSVDGRSRPRSVDVNAQVTADSWELSGNGKPVKSAAHLIVFV
jgi:hypothetical protein